jgi:hypothetical protein
MNNRTGFMIFWTKDKFSMNLGKVQTAFKIFLVLENKLKFRFDATGRIQLSGLAHGA